MLQPAISKPGKALSSLLPVADHTDPCRPSAARMSISRVSPDVNTELGSGLLQQAEEYIRRSFAAEFVKEESGMTVNIEYTHFKGSCKGLRREREDVEWEGVLRGSKRREISLERESRSDKFTELDHHHHLQLFNQSGESDLTTEQSAACMAAESTSTRSTSSLDEDACLLKLQPAAPAVAGYIGGLVRDEDDDDDEDDNSSKPCPNAMQAAFASFDASTASAACAAASYDVHKPTLCVSRFHDDDHLYSAGDNHWLAGSYDVKKSAACANYDLLQHPQHDRAGHDWLDLRLGYNFDTSSAAHASSSSTPNLCTLQLLPQDPDCASMKEREKQRELKQLCSDDFTKKTISYEEVELASQNKPPNLMSMQNYFDQAGTIRENHHHFYTNLLHLPMPTADSISQYIASRPGIMPMPYASGTADVSSMYSNVSPIDHHPPQYSSHQQEQQHLQDNSMHCRTPLHAFQEQLSFKSMSLSMSSPPTDLQDAARPLPRPLHNIVSRLPAPDFLHQNWDQIGPPSSATPSVIIQPATSFRELIASSFLREPNNRYDHLSTPVIQEEPFSDLHTHQNWPNKLQNQEKSSHFFPDQRLTTANTIEHINYNSNMTMGLCSSSSRSMTSWLSQALSASDNLVHPRILDDQSSPPQASMAPFLSTIKQNGDRKHTQIGSSLKCSSSSTSRGSPGFWFGLQPAQPEYCEGELIGAAKTMSYIRMKDGDVPISAVKKFLVTKLGLSDESQVGVACRGKFVEEAVDLKSIQDEIWLPAGFADQKENPLNFRSTPSSTFPKDTIMILTYHLS